MIYTGYFAKYKKYIENNLYPVSIAGKAPEFYKGSEYKKLAPKYGFFKAWKNGEIDNFGYVECFNKEVLEGLNQNDIQKELYDLSEGKDIVLLCYEKPGDFCHRHLVADWLEHANIRVDEYEI